MNKFIQYLHKNPFRTLAICIFYYLAVVLPHEEVGKIIARTLDEPLGRDTYNLIILSLAIIGFLILSFLLYKKLKSDEKKGTLKALLLYMILDIILIILSVNSIMVVNVELIHVVQYAVMAILLFGLFKTYFISLFFSCLLGAVDELYQYVILAPTRTDYYDLNDVVINLLGAILGLLIIRFYGVKEDLQSLASNNKIVRWFAFSIAIIIALGLVLGYFTIYPALPDEGKVIFEFIRENHSGFWRELPPNVRFHVIHPLEAMIYLAILFWIYRDIGGIGQKHQTG